MTVTILNSDDPEGGTLNKKWLQMATVSVTVSDTEITYMLRSDEEHQLSLTYTLSGKILHVVVGGLPAEPALRGAISEDFRKYYLFDWAIENIMSGVRGNVDTYCRECKKVPRAVLYGQLIAQIIQDIQKPPVINPPMMD